MSVGIYKITNKINGKVYIGQSHNIKKRMYDYRVNRTHNNHLNNAFIKYGIENFKFEVIRVCRENRDLQKNLNKWECYYIKKYESIDKKKGYNKKYGGSTGLHTEETKKKMSESHKGLQIGKNHYMYGKHPSKETRKKMSESHRGKKHYLYGKHPTKETLKKMSESRKGLLIGEKNPMYGKHHSEEAKKKISKSRKGKYTGEKNPFYGRQHSEEAKKKMRESHVDFSGEKSPKARAVVCLDTKKVFSYIGLASKCSNTDRSGISATCNGKQKTSGGFHWQYFDKYLEIHNRRGLTYINDLSDLKGEIE